ncbi:MAG: reverse transcriptase domain-containing protein [Muribaculaceae bacterium]|nr:reverse transcriptase domain-containing protein [Muribaculaceae bacterium]
MLRQYYHSDWYFDTDGNLQKTYQSLKQGCSVASWLADVLLFHIDEMLDRMDGEYVRYSDDMLFVGEDYNAAMICLSNELDKMQMKLNPKKVELLSPERWFKFLGYSIKGDMISLSSTRIKKFQKEIEGRTTKAKGTTFRKAVNAVNRFLYKGDGEHSWATQILPVCNVVEDIQELNKFVMDCLRAVKTGKKKVGGLGYAVSKKDGCVERGLGRNVKANKEKVEGEIDGYLTLNCMRNAMLTSRDVYRTLVSSL